MTKIQVEGLELRLSDAFQLGPITLDLESKSCTALVGPSGSGKTTLLRCLAGLQAHEGGRILFGDRVASDPKIRVKPSDRRIGFVFQDGALWPHMSAVEHLRFANPTLSRQAAEDLLAQTQLFDVADRKPAALSGGERQRLALARALACQPDVLFLDEPLNSVDVALRDQLGALIRSLAERHGLTLVLVTHDRDEALNIADRLIVMRDGKVVERGTPEDLLRRPATAFTAAFLGGAICLPTTRREDVVDTAFGPLASDADPASHLALTLLPGDVRMAAGDGANTLRTKVLRVLRGLDGTRALVDVNGHSLQVSCEDSLQPGQEVVIELAEGARLLPTDEVRA